jgi:hypothetical protein
MTRRAGVRARHDFPDDDGLVGRRELFSGAADPNSKIQLPDALWARKSADWETELASLAAELSALERSATSFVATGERILELVKRAGILYKNPGFGRTAARARIGAIELHRRSRTDRVDGTRTC